MKNNLFLSLAMIGALACSAHADIIDVSGPLSSAGVSAAIVSAPADMRDDAAYNWAQQGFNEVQNFVLTQNIAVDDGMILAGTRINSHMIFLNSGANGESIRVTHNDVTWSFDGEVLGVMGDRNGELEALTNDLLGAEGTIYQDGKLKYRGLEGRDDYEVLGNQLTIDMTVTEPGDWVRVITLAGDPMDGMTPNPEPGTIALFGAALAAGWAVRRRRVKA
ncbi:MAG: PEP-CTERM sorting domain-containing protein [Planctomycetota bacterium]